MTESLIYSDLNHVIFFFFLKLRPSKQTRHLVKPAVIDKYLPVKKIRVRKNDIL